MLSHDVRKVDVVKHTARTTETVGDDGTIDSDYLSKARRPTTSLDRIPFYSMSSVSEDEWQRIFMRDDDDVPHDVRGRG